MSVTQKHFWTLDEAPPAAEFQWSEKEIREVRFMVLADAARSLVDQRVSRQEYEEDLMWIKNDAWGPFTFRACCAEQGVDADELRERLLDYAMRRQFRAKPAPRVRRPRDTHQRALFPVPNHAWGV
ncbi:hypothetical protein BMS3Bbin13_00066 [bacterium BMS3Bbin13]|nr:hypothetical protein BMS3Bbin13_00066 [bacterium BMS3Bbin13]